MMSSIDWGSVPDWLGAIGSVGAIGAALIIANMERRRADRAEAASDAAARALIVEIGSTALIAASNCRRVIAAVDRKEAVEAEIAAWARAMATAHRICTDLNAATRDPKLLAVLAAMAQASKPPLPEETHIFTNVKANAALRLQTFDSVLSAFDLPSGDAPG